MLKHCDGRAVAPRTLNDWRKEAVRYADVDHRKLHATRHTAASRLIAVRATVSRLRRGLATQTAGRWYCGPMPALTRRRSMHWQRCWDSRALCRSRIRINFRLSAKYSSAEIVLCDRVIQRRDPVIRPSYSVAAMTCVNE